MSYLLAVAAVVACTILAVAGAQLTNFLPTGAVVSGAPYFGGRICSLHRSTYARLRNNLRRPTMEGVLAHPDPFETGVRGKLLVRRAAHICRGCPYDLKPTLTRHGDSIKNLVEQFDSKAGEIKALFNDTVSVDATRTTFPASLAP